jgi:hypothetical protein
MVSSHKVKQISKGLLTYIPGWQKISRKEGGGGSIARYCYAVWLRHRILTFDSGMIVQPSVVAEFGPGDSIGCGLAAIITGSSTYIAFDIVKFTNLSSNIAVFDELVLLFKNKAAIPDDLEFPDYFRSTYGENILQDMYPRLENYDFPNYIYSDEWLAKYLNEERINTIRNILIKNSDSDINNTIQIRYVAPWKSSDLQQKGLVDLMFTQAVMEHIDDLEDAYYTMWLWLKKGGMISHEIDFKSHATSDTWDGHWKYSDLVWKIIRGRRPYYINRKMCSYHLNLIIKNGFEIIKSKRQIRIPIIKRTSLAKSLSNAIEEDLNTSSVHIIAKKY